MYGRHPDNPEEIDYNTVKDNGIITDNQKPSWLNTENEKIKIINPIMKI